MVTATPNTSTFQPALALIHIAIIFVNNMLVSDPSEILRAFHDYYTSLMGPSKQPTILAKWCYNQTSDKTQPID